MQNDSLDIFVSNLEEMLSLYESYDKLAIYLGIPTDTLKSWILKTRCPKLSNLDLIANKLGCYSADLIRPKNIINSGKYDNFSRMNFVKNINIIFIEKGCYNTAQKLNLLNNVITDHMLISYMRKNDYRTPTLTTLDNIADQLNIKTFELIKEVPNEKTNFTN